MKNLIKLTVLLAATFLVTNQAVAKSVSKNISQAPEIAASYSQVQSDLAKHIGVNVRWGGQVIGTNKLDKVTRVTLLSYPLDAKGKPSVNQAVTGEVFAVNFNKETLPKRLAVGNFVTVYGTVNGGVKLVNGPLETIVPVIASQEAKKWKARSIAGLNRNRLIDLDLPVVDLDSAVADLGLAAVNSVSVVAGFQNSVDSAVFKNDEL